MAGRDVLIVDDDRQVRDVLHQIFLAAGYKCVLAKDGDEGLQVFKAGRPPLVVTDLKMPGITGIERREQQKAYGQRQETTLGRADVVQRDVLIVEEEPGIRSLLQQIFLAAGY